MSEKALTVGELLSYLHTTTACEEALEWLASLGETTPAAQAYVECPNRNWIVWLYCELGLGEQYDAVQQSAWEQYLAVKRTAREQFEAVWQPAWEQYRAVQQPAREQYEAVERTAWEQYETVTRTAREQYEIFRLAWPIVEVALRKRMRKDA